MNWHYVEQGQQIGPVSEEQFEALTRSGKIQPDTMVWREGMTDWQPYQKVRNDAPPSLSPAIELGKTAEAVCTECGGIFPVNETIRYGNARVCANCKPVFMQKLSEGAQIKTGELNYARIFSRFAAVILDGLILMAINVGIGLIAGLSLAQAAGARPKGVVALQLVLFAIQMTIAIAYEVFLIGKYGATLGKMACKVKVVTADGGRISYARAFGRYFAKTLSALTCFIGYIIALFDNPQKRALHDHICNTRVIYK